MTQFSRVLALVAVCVIAGGLAPAPALAACPSWMSDSSIPACPSCPGVSAAQCSRMLDDRYPAMAHVVQAMPQNNTSSAQGYAVEFIDNTLQLSGGREPVFYLPMSASASAQVRTDLISRLQARTPPLSAAAATALAARILIPVPVTATDGGGTSWTWQQDYFESFIDPATGMPQVREIRDYGRAGTSFADMRASNGGAGGCSSVDFSNTTLPPAGSTDTPPYAYESAHSGGNIEGLPGGMCMHGNNQLYSNYAKYYCGRAGTPPAGIPSPRPSGRPATGANEVILETSWLNVGHVDEIVNVVRNPRASAPCDFSISVASPRKALELLRANPTDVFADFTSRSGESADVIRDERGGTDPMRFLCGLVARNPAAAPGGPGGPPGKAPVAPPASGSLFRRLLEEGIVRSAEATVVRRRSCGASLGTMTNADVLRGFENDATARLTNALVDRSMAENRRRLLASFQARLGCEPNVIEVPDLFYGSQGAVPAPLLMPPGYPRGTAAWNALDTDAQMRHIAGLPNPEQFAALPEGMIDSMMPNPTNGVSAGNGFIFSDPQNRAFRSYLRTTYQGTGLRTRFMDTWDSAHVGQGNLHCSTHTLRFCRPAGRGSP